MKEEIKQQVCEEIFDYLKETVEDFELEAQLALRKMDRCRAPLNSINYRLSESIAEYMEEWLHNEIDTEELLSVEKFEHKPSVFDMVNSLSRFTDVIKGIAETVRAERPESVGYLDEAVMNIGGAYIALNNYLENN